MHLGLISIDIPATSAWAQQQGFTVIDATGRVVRVDATAAQVSQAFSVAWEMQDATHWHTADIPTLPDHIQAVSGLSNTGILKHYHVIPPSQVTADGVPPITTNGPKPGYTPSQIQAAYGITQPWDGAGETLAVAEWGSDFSPADLDLFSTTFGLPAVTPRVVNVSGYTPGTTAGVEANLDVQWAHGMAPGAALTVYNAPPGTSYSSFALEVTALLNAVLSDSQPPSVLSISYGNGEVSFTAQDLKAWDLLMEDLGNQGVTVLVASGDQGAYGMHNVSWPQTPNACAPATCTHALAIGGTSLFMNVLTKEAEWGWSNAINYGATGGGYSKVFKAPPYQAPNTWRSVPDLSAVADPFTPCILAMNGQWWTVGGTSVATPIVAGLLTRINHARRLAGFRPLGYINPVLYALELQGKHLCTDLTVGNNTCFSVAGYDAKVGHDAMTGWGSPIAQAWFDELAWGAPQP